MKNASVPDRRAIQRWTPLNGPIPGRTRRHFEHRSTPAHQMQAIAGVGAGHNGSAASPARGSSTTPQRGTRRGGRSDAESIKALANRPDVKISPSPAQSAARTRAAIDAGSLIPGPAPPAPPVQADAPAGA